MEETKVAIYIRVSTLDQVRDGFSLDAQEKALRKWCSEKKYEVYDLYADRGISGKNIIHRPDMKRLLKDASEQKFNIVIFWALSRFTRSVSDLYNTLEKFQKWNIEMISFTESFDTTTPMGRAMVGMMGIFAQLEREVTGERIRAALTEKASKGHRTCSQIIGYDTDGCDNFIINKCEAEYVKFCFDQYLKYKNLSRVAELCKEAGYKGKRGSSPSPQAIRVILTRSTYCGFNSFHGKRIQGKYEPIIDIDTFNKVQKLLKKHGKGGSRSRRYKIHTIKKL